MKKTALLFFVVFALVACGGGGEEEVAEKPQLGFVTNGVGSFWVIASKGVEAAQKYFNASA